MSETWDESRCNDRSGFLFSHDCLQMPSGRCAQCERPICEDHSQPSDESGVWCKTCAKQLLQSSGSSSSTTNRRYQERQGWSQDDPYFYGGYHYAGWGYYGPGYWGHRTYQSTRNHDPHDFTEADSESLRDDDEPAEFEKDMSES